MYEYGNARVAALRARLLSPSQLHQLAEAESPTALLEQLAHLEEWRSFVAQGFPGASSESADAGATDPVAAAQTAVERHRSARLGALPRWYEPPARALVEALVLKLDAERTIDLLRLLVAGTDPEVALGRVGAGALLARRQLEEIARAPTLAASVRLLGHVGLIERRAAERLASLCDRGEAWAAVEAGLVDACWQARVERAIGEDPSSISVREVLAAERAVEHSVFVELSEQGIEAAASLERRFTLGRLDTLGRRARRDPLGVGVVAGYVAALEAQAIGLRAILSRVMGRWSRERTAGYMRTAGG